MHCQSSTKHSFIRSMARFFLVAGLLLALLLPGGASPALAYGLATISITDTSLAEGDSGASNMLFTLTRSGDTSSTVEIGYTTEDGSASAGTDYTAQTGTVIFASGATSATVAIPIIGNITSQSNRTFTLRLTGVNNSYGPPVTLAAKHDFTTGAGARAVALGDVNGDGKPDLAVANFNSANVSVLLNITAPGAATPSFAAKNDFVTGNDPISLALGDVNGDGKPDLAVANYLDSSVSVLLNTTAPGATTASFAAKTDFATGDLPFSVALGDVNGDGKPDLTVANNNSNTVSVLRNTTTPGATPPSFATKVDFPTGTRPYAVALGDVNGDGKPDLAVANNGSASVSVLLNTTTPGAATPSFAAKTDFATGTTPWSVALGDVNGDGKADLAVANYGGSSVSVLLNTTAPGAATPSFAAKTDFATGINPFSVTLGDMNGDGKPDLAVANASSNNVSLLLNLAVTFTPATATGTIIDDDVALSVSKAGAGNGMVSSNPSGLTCGGDCSAHYPFNTVVTLTATADTGSSFGGWSGSGCSATGTCVLTMSSAKAVTATFSLNSYVLTTATTGTGSGSVSLNPAGGMYTHGTVVVVAATPATGSIFSGWSGACSGSGAYSVEMDAAKSVTATFDLNNYVLTTATAGTGSGSVSLNPVGGAYTHGTVVAVTATPATGSIFSGWSGACSGSGACSVKMDAAKSVTATFDLNNYVLTTATAGTGSGSISLNPAGGVYTPGTVVVVTATPATGSSFSGWSGACSGSGACSVTLDAAKSVTATFDVASNPSPGLYLPLIQQ